MNNFIVALMLAAGVSAFAYAKLGRRVGYGNPSDVWKLVIFSFVLTFLIVLILLKTLVSIN